MLLVVRKVKIVLCLSICLQSCQYTGAKVDTSSRARSVCNCAILALGNQPAIHSKLQTSLQMNVTICFIVYLLCISVGILGNQKCYSAV